MGVRLVVLSMDDLKLKLLLQAAEDHMRRLSCRQRYEQATSDCPTAVEIFGSVRRSGTTRWLRGVEAVGSTVQAKPKAAPMKERL